MALEFQPLFSDDCGGVKPPIIAGPCSAETRNRVLATAEGLRKTGVKIFRAGVWKPRTRPGAFEGSGVQALQWLAEAMRRNYDGLMIESHIAPARAWTDASQQVTPMQLAGIFRKIGVAQTMLV